MSAGEDPMWGNPEAWQKPDLTAMPVAEMFETSVNMAPVKPIMQQPAVQPPIPVHQQQLPVTVHQKPLLPLTVTVPCPCSGSGQTPSGKRCRSTPGAQHRLPGAYRCCRIGAKESSCRGRRYSWWCHLPFLGETQFTPGRRRISEVYGINSCGGERIHHQAGGNLEALEHDPRIPFIFRVP